MAGIGTGFLTGLVLGGATAAAAALLLPAGGARVTPPAVGAPSTVAAPARPQAPVRPQAPAPASAIPATPTPPPAPSAPAEPPAPPPPAEAAPGAAPAPTPALRHAQPFTAPAGRPLVALVLRAGGTDFADLRLPVTVALPAEAPEAAAIAARHQANGHEVAVLLDGPAPVEAALAAARALPAGTAVLAPEAAAPAALARRLMAENIGLVAGPGSRSGLPPGAAPLFLSLAPGVGSEEIARALARVQQDAMPGYGVILVAPAEPAVLDALLDWRMGAGAGYALAPLSALLLEPR